MKIECSEQAPWGIHQSLADLRCPRCGWEAPMPKARTPEPVETSPAWIPFGAMIAAAAPRLLAS